MFASFRSCHDEHPRLLLYINEMLSTCENKRLPYKSAQSSRGINETRTLTLEPLATPVVGVSVPLLLHTPGKVLSPSAVNLFVVLFPNLARAVPPLGISGGTQRRGRSDRKR